MAFLKLTAPHVCVDLFVCLHSKSMCIHLPTCL